MKVAINITRETLGGITASNLNLIKHLYKNNIQVVGLELNIRRYMKGPAIYRKFDPLLFDHNIINIHDYNIKELISTSKTLKELENSFKDIINIIVKILKEEGAGVILISGTYYIPWLLSLAAKKAKIPIVLWYSGVLTKETENCLEQERFLYKEMEKSIISRADKIIFPSKICKDEVERLVVKKIKSRSFVIPNPVSLEFTEDHSVDYSVGRSIAAVGRNVPIKNFETFFKIHKNLIKEGWQHECTLVTSVNKETIKKIPKTVTISPPMNHHGLKKFYATQGLIISPSHFETFGNVPMEAVSMGIPVLVSDGMGCSEILKKAGLSNMVISFNNIETVTQRVKELCGQSILPQQINAVRKLLDAELINEKIKSVLLSSIINY